MLTLSEIASSTNVIPYSSLLEQLRIETLRELEDLIIDSIYDNLIEAKLDHKA